MNEPRIYEIEPDEEAQVITDPAELEGHLCSLAAQGINAVEDGVIGLLVIISPREAVGGLATKFDGPVLEALNQSSGTLVDSIAQALGMIVVNAVPDEDLATEDPA